MKEKAKHFFTKTKFGKWLMKSMALLNSVEGIVHLLVATVGTVTMFKVFGIAVITHMLFFGGFKAGITMWGLMMPNIENLVFGLFSLAVGYVLGISHHHHH